MLLNEGDREELWNIVRNKLMWFIIKFRIFILKVFLKQDTLWSSKAGLNRVASEKKSFEGKFTIAVRKGRKH